MLAEFKQPITKLEEMRTVYSKLRLLKAKELRELFVHFVGKEPLTYDAKALQPAVAYSIMFKSGDVLYNGEGEPRRVRNERLKAIDLCCQDVIQPDQEQKSKEGIVDKNEVKTVKTETVKTEGKVEEKTENPYNITMKKAKKSNGMTFDQVVERARSLGVEGIDAQLKRPRGLASMWLRNQIRAKSKT